MSRYLSMFLEGTAKACSLGRPVPNKSEKAKIPCPRLATMTHSPPHSGFSPFSPFPGRHTEKNAPSEPLGNVSANDVFRSEAGRHRTDIASVLALPVDLGELPTRPCSGCGRGLWWRVSTIEPGGPGPWCCMRCVAPSPEDWIDGCAVPIGKTKEV